VSAKRDVLLIDMPFSYFLAPSIGLGLLKASLALNNIESKILHFNLRFAELIGQDHYLQIYFGTRTENLVGEWIFSNALFQNQSDSAFSAFMNEVLRADSRGAYETQQYSEESLQKTSTSILEAKNHVENFLDECLAVVCEYRPKVLGFTSTFHQHVPSLSLAKRIKSQLPETFIVFGGSNCEGVMGRETLKQFEFVDAVVSGEGECVFPELVRYRLNDDRLPHQDGVYMRQQIQSRVLHQPIRNTRLVDNMDDLPIPDYDDFFQQLEGSSLQPYREPTLLFETSRGCWWGEKQHCTFCGLNGNNIAYRSKSAQRALSEFDYLTARHPTPYMNVVDNILDMDYFKEFIPLLAERKQKLNIYYEVKANLRKEQLRLLSAAGITYLQPGIESFSDNVLTIMKKGVSGLQNIQLIKWCKELRLRLYYHIIFGFPGENADDYREMSATIPLLTHLSPPRASTIIRLDRFSPNFEDAEHLGFTNLAPKVAYEHVYPLTSDALSNLAYFFSFEYVVPQNVKEYVKPLLFEIEKWKDIEGTSSLFFIEKGRHLAIWDFRPIAKRRLTLLSGFQKFIYQACDEVMTPRRLLDLWQQSNSDGRITESDVIKVLEELVRQNLIIRSKASYLALAISASSYQASNETAA